MSKYLILIIDDDPTQHIILREYLRKAGYEVSHAENGEQGLKAIEKQQPDLILLDVQMPGMDGFQVLEKIKNNKAYKDINILLLTALNYQHLKVQGLEIGADDYITKPFNKDELLARISAVLRRSNNRRHSKGIMEGDLAHIGIADLLQSMELGLKTALIRLKDMNAEIAVKNGKLLYARFGNFKGDEALLRIFLLDKGYFSVQFNEELPDNINLSPKSLTSVLMNVSNNLDEINDIIKQLEVQERKLIIKGDISEFKELAKIKDMLPATFKEIITSMEGTLKDNIKTLITASQKRILKIEKKVYLKSKIV